MNDPAKPVAVRPPHVALGIAGALLLASVVAVVIDRVGACGSCAIRQGPWKFVAPGGVVGYAVLTAVGLLSPHRLFPIGSAIAAAVHTVLAAAMAVQSKVCPICIVAAALAIALFLVMLVRSQCRMRLIACVYVPVVLFASGPTAWALAQEGATESERQAFIRTVRGADRDAVLTIQVFEQDHCPYCRDFRELYLPRLERDFGGRVRLRFLPATATTWVQRTPTIVIEGGIVYEGLPDYSQLCAAVEHALEK